MPTPHFLGFVAAVGLGLLTFHLVQANREQRHAVKASTSPNSRTRKDEEGDDRGDASGVNVRGGDSSIQRRGDNHREYCAEKNDLDAREYSYEVRKLHELFPAATLNTCRSIFEANKGNMDECIDFLLKHHDNLDNARDSKVLPVSDDTVAEKMPEMIQLDSKVTPTAEVDLKATHNREELLSELSYLNALEQEIERKKTALREEEYALQALQIRIEGMKSDDNGSLSLEQVHDSEGPTKDNAEVKVTEVGSAQGAHVLGQVALSMVPPMPEALTKEFAISELSMSDAAVSRAISKGSVCEPESASCYSEQTIDSPNQEDDDHRSESSWSDLGAGSIGADEH